MAKGSFRGNNKNEFKSGKRFQGRYCFTFNNEGICKDPACHFGHFCQICKGNHGRTDCTRKKHTAGNKQNNQPSTKPITNTSVNKLPNSQVPNEFNIVTPIKTAALQIYLKGYEIEKSKFLMEGFKLGFKIPFIGKEEFMTCQNLKSAKENPDILNEKIQKELLAGRIEGPFSNPPFENFRASPLGLVPKKNNSEYRVIHHLSYPDGCSVNDGIDPSYTSVEYQSVDMASDLILKFGKIVYFQKLTLSKHLKSFLFILPIFICWVLLLKRSFILTKPFLWV